MYNINETNTFNSAGSEAQGCRDRRHFELNLSSRPENFRPKWDSSLDLCDAGEVLYQFDQLRAGH